MIPIKLTIEGFLSYKERQEINFDSFDVACISGANGSGKSSLLDAITWALFGQARKRDDSLINSRSKQAEVSFTFLYEENTYRIHRVKPEAKSTILEFQIQTEDGSWKALTDRTMRGTESLIADTLKLEYETFVNASFFLQGKADQFTQQRPGDRKRILSNILGLGVWESYRKKASNKRRVISSDITGLDGRLSEINQELDEGPQRKENLKQLNKNLETISTALEIQKKNLEIAKSQNAALEEQKSLLSNFEEQIDTSSKSLSELDIRLTSRIDEKDQYSKLLSEQEQIEQKNEEWQNTKFELENWNNISKKFNQQEQLRRDPLILIENERTRLETEKAHLLEKEAEVTPSKEELKVLENKYLTLEELVKENEKNIEERDKIKADLDNAVNRQSKAAAENPVLKEEMNKMKARLDQLESHEEPDCPFCGKPLSPEERGNLIEEISTEGKELGDKFRENSKLLEQADKHVSDLKDKLRQFDGLDTKFLNASLEYDQTSVNISQIKSRITDWENVDALKLAEISENLINETYSPEAKLQLQQIDQELIKIGYDVETHDQIRKKEADLRSIEEKYLKLNTANAAVAPLEREISDIKDQIKKLKDQTNKIKSEFEKLNESYQKALSQIPDLIQTEREMLQVQQDENKLRQEVGAAQQKVNVLDTLKIRKAELEAERNELTINLSQFQELERAFGKDGVPALLIEQALPQIERKANEILQNLSGGDMTISFVTQKEYKDKKRDDLQETLDLRIRDSRGERDYEMFSGGEAFRINFAVRLALSEVLSQRAGAKLQTLVIDEGFGSQDEIGMQRLVYAINSIKDRFEKILVITHIDSLKEAFPNRIEVEKTKSGSVVTIL